ncbi:MAG TPA: NUDIX hydrolase [Rhodanobacteraceae bacterium]|nr:NUDIX hydrolase [Rhodanobacteraceae bacterium]
MADETLYQGRWLRLKRHDHWEYVERANAAGAVVIVAVTDAGALLVVEQRRVPIDRTTIELPAGLIGDLAACGDEPLAEAATRELEEETGYRCACIEHLHSGPSSAGMSTEFIHFVRAVGLQRVGAGGGDDSEDITVHEVPLADVPAWLQARARAGLSVDPKLMTGLWLLDHPGPFNEIDDGAPAGG